MDSATTKGGIAKLVGQLSRRHPRLIVVEATGGYEEGVVRALFEQMSVTDAASMKGHAP